MKQSPENWKTITGIVALKKKWYIQCKNLEKVTISSHSRTQLRNFNIELKTKLNKECFNFFNMKRAILIFALLITNISFAQIYNVTEKSNTIGKIAPMGKLVISLEKHGNDYVFTYRDAKFMHLDNFKTFTYEGGNVNLFTLYATILDGIEYQPEENKVIKLSKGILILKFGKAMGVKNVEIGYSLEENSNVVGFSRALTKTDIQKLFDIKE